MASNPQSGGWMRSKEGLGVWEHKGKVAVSGYGHSPVERRWDENVEHSLGAMSILAAEKALEDCGLSKDDVDGIVSAPGPLGDNWGPRPFFEPPYDSEDGLTKVTAEWLAKNGGFKKVEDLMNVSGVGEKSFLKMKPLITVTAAKPGQ